MFEEIIKEKMSFEDCTLNKYVYNFDNSILFNVRINEQEMGSLLNWTKSATQITNYSNNELREIHINNFIPKCFIDVHTKILFNYIKSGISHRNFNTIKLPFINKLSNIKYADLLMKPCVNVELFEINILAYLNFNVTQEKSIIIDPRGYIDSYSPELSKILNTKNDVTTNNKHILNYCPSLFINLFYESEEFRALFTDNEDKSCLLAKSSDYETYFKNKNIIHSWKECDNIDFFFKTTGFVVPDTFVKYNEVQRFIKNFVFKGIDETQSISTTFKPFYAMDTQIFYTLEINMPNSETEKSKSDIIDIDNLNSSFRDFYMDFLNTKLMKVGNLSRNQTESLQIQSNESIIKDNLLVNSKQVFSSNNRKETFNSNMAFKDKENRMKKNINYKSDFIHKERDLKINDSIGKLRVLSIIQKCLILIFIVFLYFLFKFVILLDHPAICSKQHQCLHVEVPNTGVHKSRIHNYPFRNIVL